MIYIIFLANKDSYITNAIQEDTIVPGNLKSWLNYLILIHNE